MYKKTTMVISYYIYYKNKFLEFFPKLILDRILIPLQARYYRRNNYRLFIWFIGNFIQMVYTVLTELFVITYGKPKSYFPKIEVYSITSLQGFYKHPLKIKYWHLKLELNILFYGLLIYFWGI